MQGLNEVRARCLKTPRLHSGVIPPDQTTSFRRGHDFLFIMETFLAKNSFSFTWSSLFCFIIWFVRESAFPLAVIYFSCLSNLFMRSSIARLRTYTISLRLLSGLVMFSFIYLIVPLVLNLFRILSYGYLAYCFYRNWKLLYKVTVNKITVSAK